MCKKMKQTFNVTGLKSVIFIIKYLLSAFLNFFGVLIFFESRSVSYDTDPNPALMTDTNPDPEKV